MAHPKGRLHTVVLVLRAGDQWPGGEAPHPAKEGVVQSIGPEFIVVMKKSKRHCKLFGIHLE